MTDVSMRVAYGQALAEYGAANPRIVVLDADISASSQTHYFASRHPDRFFNMGIAEAGMVDVGVGLALGGYIPFVNTFAFLLTLRAAEMVRSCVAYAQTNVKLVGAYGGLSDAFDGPTHHAITDLAVMCAMPNLTVMVASDAVQVAQMVPLIAEHPGPVYLRVSRAELPVIHSAEAPLEIGKGKLWQQGSDVTLIATGIMVTRALDAADILAAQGVSARVIEIHTLKPLDTALVRQAALETGAIVTAEEHSVVGGLGAAVAQALGLHPVPHVRIGVQDCFTETGPYEALLTRFKMTVNDMALAAHQSIEAKQA